jgi:agmatinase
MIKQPDILPGVPAHASWFREMGQRDHPSAFVPVSPTFMKLPVGEPGSLENVRAAVLGVSEASPSKPGVTSHAANAPTALRAASAIFAGRLGHFDFDLDATLFPSKTDWRGLVDLGDVTTDSFDPPGNRARIEAAVRGVLDAGAVPVILGGDDSVPIPVLAAYADYGPLTILQIDAHVDWADVVQGNPYGYGSPMRRASEYPWVTGMVQVGLRGLGSGVVSQHDDARAWGSRLVTSYDFHRQGLDAVLPHIPERARCFISLDCDGLDPSVMPAVNTPTPGGLTYEDMIRLLRAVAARAQIAGFALVEYVPDRDNPQNLAALTAARIVAVAMGLIAEA